jgi:hypothetical protein
MPTTGHLRSNIDLTTFIESAWDPYAAGNWVYPFQVQYHGETHYSNSDVPGIHNTAAVDMSSMQAQQFSNDAWVDDCNTVALVRNVTSARYNAFQVTCDEIQSYTF